MREIEKIKFFINNNINNYPTDEMINFIKYKVDKLIDNIFKKYLFSLFIQRIMFNDYSNVNFIYSLKEDLYYDIDNINNYLKVKDIFIKYEFTSDLPPNEKEYLLLDLWEKNKKDNFSYNSYNNVNKRFIFTNKEVKNIIIKFIHFSFLKSLEIENINLRQDVINSLSFDIKNIFNVKDNLLKIKILAIYKKTKLYLFGYLIRLTLQFERLSSFFIEKFKIFKKYVSRRRPISN